jgi:hypothetical protein
MAKKDLKNSILEKVALNIQAISSNTTTDGAAIDTKGYQSVTFVLQSATLTDGTYTPVIEESDTGAFAGEENAVADADLLGTEAAAAFAAADDNEVRRIGYVGNKRYVRLTLVSASTSTGGTLGAVAILGHPEVQETPVNA